MAQSVVQKISRKNVKSTVLILSSFMAGLYNKAVVWLLCPFFTVQLRSHSGSISHNFSAVISIAEGISVMSSSALLWFHDPPHLHLPSALLSIVGPSHKVLHWTLDGSDFLKLE